MESIRSNKGVCEPEMDMSRRELTAAPRKVWRLLSSLLGSSSMLGSSSNRFNLTIGTPRRSIDREQQQYAPIYD